MSEEKPKDQFTEETIPSKIFIVKGRSINTYEVHAQTKAGLTVGQRAWYMRVMTLYDHGSWVTLDSRDTGCRFRIYRYNVHYNPETKKWKWRWSGHYFVTMMPGMRHTVRNKWRRREDGSVNSHKRVYHYIYRYEPTTHHRIAAPKAKAKAFSPISPLEMLSAFNPATLINTLDKMDFLEETLAFHSTMSDLTTPFVSSRTPPTTEEFPVNLAIAMSEHGGDLTTTEDEGEEGKFEEGKVEKF
ncbi:MAG: hypothetical protein ACXADY_20750 [Candidatus Hodarchaeales archaeon]|jgi:hypothetical protein